MTTYHKLTLKNGDDIEIRTNVGTVPIISRNGVIDPTLKVTDFNFNYKDKWKPVTIWRPRKINGKWRWPGEKVFRKYHLSPGGGFYEYGDEFSVLKD